jgi:hypothetical protein
MRKFKVGDTAVGCNYFTLPDRNGMECKIIAQLQSTTAFEVRRGAYTTKPRYRVRWADGLESLARPHTLLRPSRRHRVLSANRQMIECVEYIMIAARRDWLPFVVHQMLEQQVKECAR